MPFYNFTFTEQNGYGDDGVLAITEDGAIIYESKAECDKDGAFLGAYAKAYQRIAALTAQLAAKDEQLAERERELDYFLNDVYEFGCCQFDLCASDEDHKRTMGLIWQRVCILKEAVKHGCKLPAPQQGTQA
jgi:hypothetical protein